MIVTTLAGNSYSYSRNSNKIDIGVSNEQIKDVNLVQPISFSTMPDVDTFVVCFTTKCNLRCTYCCYSGQYRNTRTHGTQSFAKKDTELLLDFIGNIAPSKPIHIMFYGGESLLEHKNIQIFVGKAKERWSDKVRFSISTNGTLLSKSVVDWAVGLHITLNVSIDGTQKHHDRYRKTASNMGSFLNIYKSLADIQLRHPTFFQENVNLLMTVNDVTDLAEIALEWDNDKLLKNKIPALVSIVAPNYSKGVPLENEDSKKKILYQLLQLYAQNPNNGVLKRFFDEITLIWNERQIFPIKDDITLPSCIPWNHKLYIDIDGSVGLCEKTCDNLRMGNIKEGIDWEAANRIATQLYNVRKDRCGSCPILRLCDICPTSLDLNEHEMDIFCHNQIIKFRLQLLMFCELAEKELI